MYAHGQAAIVLCEAYAMTGDQQFRTPAQKAVEFIQRAQHIKGGWRYRPGEAGDTSVLGWQLMAIQSARAPNLGLEIDDDTLRLAGLYLSDAAWEESPTGGANRFAVQLPTAAGQADTGHDGRSLVVSDVPGLGSQRSSSDGRRAVVGRRAFTQLR